MKEIIRNSFERSIEVKKRILESTELLEKIEGAVELINGALSDQGKVILCGNGGSASDALHIAGEMLGRFKKERGAIPAIVLNADVATMTAISNDYGFEDVFKRQLMGLMRPEDVFVAISTSGNSKNVLAAIKWAHSANRKTIALLGKDGGDIRSYADISIIVPSDDTARIQESHITIGHILCELVEMEFMK
ncbi:MAG: SIS domain-containing protein [Peptostreptococcaceae bacterium]|nr:SIS domain-containing protein [Peptostreptococcaceae bacterium]